MSSKEFQKLRKEFKAHLRRVRGHVAAANLFIDSADLSRAYEEAEKAQLAAFDAKNLLNQLVRKLNVGDKVRYQWYDAKITGFDGTFYRVAVQYDNDVRHEWANPDDLEKIDG